MARQEARILRRLRDSHIVELIDAFEDADNVYLVLELIEGQDLYEGLQATGPLPERTARRLMLQVLRALGACHDAGLVHRDLKPENLMLRGDLHSGSLTLIDFGLAVECVPGKVVRADVAGTRGFLAPEGERGTFSCASDVFACGKVLEQLLVDASPEAADLLAQLLQQDAEQRPSAAEALRHPWLAHEDVLQARDLEAIRSQQLGTVADFVELPSQAVLRKLERKTGFPADTCGIDLREAASRSSTRGSGSCTSASSWASDCPSEVSGSPEDCQSSDKRQAIWAVDAGEHVWRDIDRSMASSMHRRLLGLRQLFADSARSRRGARQSESLLTSRRVQFLWWMLVVAVCLVLPLAFFDARDGVKASVAIGRSALRPAMPGMARIQMSAGCGFADSQAWSH